MKFINGAIKVTKNLKIETVIMNSGYQGLNECAGDDRRYVCDFRELKAQVLISLDI